MTGLAPLFELRVDGVTIRDRAPRRQAGAGHVPRGRRPARRRPGRGAVFEDALAGVRPAGPVSSATWSASTGSARPTRCARTAPTSSSRTSPSSCARRARGDLQRAVPGRAVVASRETGARPRPAGPDRVGVRAVQRPHRAARQPRRGRAVRPAGHLPQRVLRAAAAAVRRGRLRLPGVGPDRHQRDQRQADPAAGRRRAVRRALRRAARAPRAVLDLRAGILDRTVRLASPAGNRVGCARAGWCRSPSARSRRSTTRSSRSTEPVRIVVQSELVANERCPSAADPRVAAVLEPAAGGRPTTATRHSGRAGAPHPRQRAARGAPAMDHLVEVDGRVETATVAARDDWARLTVACDAARRARRCGSSSCSPTAGRPALRARAARPGRRALDRRAGHRLGGPGRQQRAYLDDFWDGADVEVDGDAGAAAGGPVRAVPRAAGRGPGRAAGDPGQGSDRARATTATPSGTPRRSCCRCSPTPRRRRPPTRCAGGTRPSTWPRAAGRASSALRAPPSRGGPSTAQECSGYWPAGHGGLPHQRRHRRRGGPLRHRRPATRTSTRTSVSSCSSRRPGCGGRSATTTAHGGSASTASPAPTSTARSPTTTSTRT